MAVYDFSRHVAFVTGAGTGMGAAAAEGVAEAGAAVALIDVDGSVVEQTASRLSERGPEVLALQCDVSNEEEIAAAVQQTVETFGRLDMAFNNAGIMIPPSDPADEDAEAFDRVTAVNLRGVWASMKYELAQMNSPGRGAIVNCSSIAGLVGGPSRASYHAAKHGVLGLTKSVAVAYAARGVRVNAICPGTIDTPMVDRMVAGGELDLATTLSGTPMARQGTAREIAEAVLWLCSPSSSYVTGIALPVDGGLAAQ